MNFRAIKLFCGSVAITLWQSCIWIVYAILPAFILSPWVNVTQYIFLLLAYMILRGSLELLSNDKQFFGANLIVYDIFSCAVAVYCLMITCVPVSITTAAPLFVAETLLNHYWIVDGDISRRFLEQFDSSNRTAVIAAAAAAASIVVMVKYPDYINNFAALVAGIGATTLLAELKKSFL